MTPWYAKKSQPVSAPRRPWTEADISAEVLKAIQSRFDTYTSKKHYCEIRASIDEAYEAHEERILTAITPGMARLQESDEASKSMAQFIPSIQKLSKLPGGLELAFGLILYLGRKSYFLTEETPFYQPCVDWIESRKSDTPADTVLLDILQRMKKKNKDFRPEEEWKSLNRQRKLFEYGEGESWKDRKVFFVHRDLAPDASVGSKDSYFPKSYEYM